MEPYVVAKIAKDYLWRETDDADSCEEGREFHLDALISWWGWPDDENEIRLCVDTAQKTKFKLFDDDDELYYSGWLLNDDGCYVQQFVQKWAEVDSGCTTILVYKDAEAGYVQEIG